MNAIQNNKSGLSTDNQKDIIKGQKILAALYMVTNHLPESDSVRIRLRALATDFVCASFADTVIILRHIEVVLGGAVFVGLISEKNSSVIIHEATRYTREYTTHDKGDDLEALFQDTQEQKTSSRTSIKDTKKTTTTGLVLSTHRPLPTMSHTKNYESKADNKNARQDTILSFINDRKSAVIKDIISLFPEVSEKTIQRELNTLIDAGRITKRGSKRWSIYMAVNSLL